MRGARTLRSGLPQSKEQLIGLAAQGQHKAALDISFEYGLHVRACDAGGAGLLLRTFALLDHHSSLFPAPPAPCPFPSFMFVILSFSVLACVWFLDVNELVSMSGETRSFLLTPTASAASEEVVGYTPSELLYGWASPPPPPTYSPGAVVGRAFSAQRAYEYALRARLERNADEFYLAVEPGDCILVDRVDDLWTLVTHEQGGVQGWIPSVCIDR